MVILGSILVECIESQKLQSCMPTTDASQIVHQLIPIIEFNVDPP